MLKALMKHGICLSRLLGIRLSLRRLVVVLDILCVSHVHFTLARIMILCGVICVILLTIMLIPIHIMHTMLILNHLYLWVSARGSRRVSLLG